MICFGSKEMKVSKDQWIVRPHPRPRADTFGSRSNTVHEISCFLNA